MKRMAALAAIMLCLPAAMCQTNGGAYPRLGDLQDVTTEKPKPGVGTLTGTGDGDRYDSEVEAWGDTVRAAGVRLCRFYEAQKMSGLHCPKD